ncbi:class I SAM-dependent methyltransferase [Paenibacillus sp. PL91]|uniref:class I SAM-dependent methyltransferase n=1 Tax=Paenibacillus sp. PL91 TaxID=2729538 RepID=UPI00145CA152|nr:class I SAM-dependent methyltransferase [Paenibacillus sp. PL91]MBC9201623.1 class I SAM-dependent methyltransferase [Paenibacillus sp. PL91]
MSIKIKAKIIVNKRLLESAAYLYCGENGMSRTSIQRPTAEEMNAMISHGVVSHDLKIMDEPFGYACYEHNRQVYDPDFFDTLLLKEAKNRKSILDLCCGGGATIVSLLQNGPDIIYGFDSNENQIELIEALVEEMNDVNCKIVAKVADAHHIPLERHSVDFVVCRVALQYLDTEQVLKEMYRVLYPNGKVFLLVHGSGYIFDYLFSRRGIFKTKLIRYAVQKLFYSSSSDHNFSRSQAHFLFTKEVKKKLKDAGFKDINVHTSKKWLKFGILPVYFAVTANI